MKAAVLSVGDELVLGTTLDTNSQRISVWLRDAGYATVRHMTVGDDCQGIADAMRELLAQSDVVIVTGGLGPTDDDLTRDALNVVADNNAPMVEDSVRRQELTRLFESRGRTMPAINVRQAMRPQSARTLPNPHGTAPGLAATVDGSRIYCLPGPPSEMQPMFQADVLPELARPGAPPIVRRVVSSFGLGESSVAEILGERMERNRQPVVGTTASQSIVSVQIVGHGADASATTATECAEVNRILAPYSLGENGETLPEALLATLRHAKLTLCVAESCTAGMAGAAIAQVPGASDVFLGGWITYSNQMKQDQLGVAESILKDHGAVSAECALAMAQGAAARSGAAIAVSITGIAGPDGGSVDKPVGTVWIAVHGTAAPSVARKFRFPGNRDAVRDRAAKAALQLARWSALGVNAPLLWEAT